MARKSKLDEMLGVVVRNRHQLVTQLHDTELHRYMGFRAAKEGMPHELGAEWYYAHLQRDGIREFFGVIVNAQGDVQSDTQNPEALEEWRQAANGMGK